MIFFFKNHNKHILVYLRAKINLIFSFLLHHHYYFIKIKDYLIKEDQELNTKMFMTSKLLSLQTD